MAAEKQTTVIIPSTLDGPNVLRRVLLTIVENIDTVLGYRGTKGAYVSSTELSEALAAIEDEDSEESPPTSESLSLLTSDYYDLSNEAYFNLNGFCYFSALGSDILNSPISLTAGTTYAVFIESKKVDTFIVQTFRFLSPVLEVFDRAGDSIATSVVKVY